MNSDFSILSATDSKRRKQFLVDVFIDNFEKIIKSAPAAWIDKFRKMAASPVAFYRGSAVLFYADIAQQEELFTSEKANRVWIQGDLHAENFGTYMDSEGILVFDVNDFDEAYVGPFAWDIKRMAASVALIGYQKALSDEVIRQMITRLVESYCKQVEKFAATSRTEHFALTLENTKGKLFEKLQNARLKTRVSMLDRLTKIENYERKFILTKHTLPINDSMRSKVLASLEHYFQNIPPRKRLNKTSYVIKDVVEKNGVGIGSAGFRSFNILLEGHTQALENDIVIYMKQAQEAAPSRYVQDKHIKDYFIHDGHRTVVSQRALQAHSNPLLSYTTLDEQGQIVAEIQPNTTDLDWEDINDVKDILQVLGYLGQAVAKIHCISDADSDQTLVPFSTDKAIHEVFKEKEEKFINYIVDFGESYAKTVRNDYLLFIDLFRNQKFPGLNN